MNLTPGSPEWTKLVTASKVPAILGVSPWQSPFSLWQEMKGNVQRPEANDAQRRGTYLEPAILAWWRDRHADDISDHEIEQPTYTLGDWAAATPDLFVTEPDGTPLLVEAKSAASDDEWGEPGTDQIPGYYLAQVHWQMHVSGISRCYVPIITGRLRFAEYVVDADPEVGRLLEAKCREFYDSLAADEPPPLDDTTATFETLKRLHPDIDKGESVELDRDAAWRLVQFADDLKANTVLDREARSVALDHMGRAQYLTCEGVRIARRQNGKGGAVSFHVIAKPADLLTEEAS